MKWLTKKIANLNKYQPVASAIALVCLVLFGFWFRLNSLDLSKLPVIYNDSATYTAFANFLVHGQMPDIAFRTFLYPSFIALFNLGSQSVTPVSSRLAGMIVVQIIIGIGSVAFFYELVRRWTRSWILALVAGVLFAANFALFSFDIIVLTENLSIFVLMANILFHIRRLRKIDKPYEYPLMILLDVALIFVRPIFIALPFCLWIYEWVVLNQIKSRAFAKKALLAMGVLAVVIIGWCAINSYQNGFFGFSIVSKYNKMGKLLHYGYLAPDGSVPQAEQVRIKQSESVYKDDPFDYMTILTTPEEWDAYNKAAIKGRSKDYYLRSLKDMKAVLSVERFPYTQPNIEFALTSIYQYFGKLYNKINAHFNWFLSWVLIFVIANLVFSVYLYRKYKAQVLLEDAVVTLFVFLITFYQIGVVAVGSYAEYYRLRVPAEPFLTVMLPIVVFLLLRNILALFNALSLKKLAKKIK